MLYNKLISNLISCSNYDTDIKTELLDNLNNPSRLEYITFIPPEVKVPTRSLISPEDLGAGTLNRILGLHDGTFLIFKSDNKALHYSSKWILKSEFPFEYTNPFLEPTAYMSVADACSVTYTYNESNISQSASIVFVALPNSEIIQVYNYKNDIWSHISTLGTVDTAGSSTILLDEPTAVSAYIGTDNFIYVAVSCLGADSFIKTYKMNTAGVVSDPTIISYPGQHTSEVANQGKLASNETKDITRLIYKEGNLWVLNGIEFGNLKIIDNKCYTVHMNIGNLFSIDYDDYVYTPNCFSLLGDNMITGDLKGHLSKISTDISNLIYNEGISLEDTETTSYPSQYKSIIDLNVIANSLYIISGNKLYTHNLPELADVNIAENVIVDYDCNLKEYAGFPDNVKFGINEVFKDPYSIELVSGDTLNINIFIPITGLYPLKKGVVILERVKTN